MDISFELALDFGCSPFSFDKVPYNEFMYMSLKSNERKLARANAQQQQALKDLGI